MPQTEFELQRAQKGLGRGGVVAIAGETHTRPHVGTRQFRAVRVRRILPLIVRVVKQRWRQYCSRWAITRTFPGE
jgi:hypothetical protein